MAIVFTKSASITSLDASPGVAVTTGEGAQAMMHVASDNITTVVGDSINSIYRIVRIPTDAKIKQVLLNYPGSTAGAADIDVLFSDSPYEGSAAYQALAGGVVQTTGPADNKLFGTALTLIGLQRQLDITFVGAFTAAHQNLPLWQVLVNLGATQFTSDPGGAFDIGVKLTTALTVTAGLLNIEVRYAE